MGSLDGRRFAHPTAVRERAHAAAEGEERGRHQPAFYTHTHTDALLPRGGAGGRCPHTGSQGTRGAEEPQLRAI